MFAIIVSTALTFLLGHVFRDGWPPTGQTQVARVSGALLCCVGLYYPVLHGLGSPWVAGIAGFNYLFPLYVAVPVLIGFFIDSDHARGQQARGWADAGFLLISGLTSVLPMIVLLSLLISGPYILGWSSTILWPLAAAFLKPPIWFLTKRWIPTTEPFFYYTRVSAGLFGAAFGATVAIALQ